MRVKDETTTGSADEWVALVTLVDAVRAFINEGTVLTMCDRGPCQQVIEHKDNSDPQAKLIAALRAYDTILVARATPRSPSP